MDCASPKMTKKLLALALFALTSSLGASESAKPVLLLGSGYGQHERAALVRSVLSPRGVAFESSGKWISPADWGKFSAVVIADEAPQALNEESAVAVKTYLENGGGVILTGGGLPSLAGIRGDTIPAWFPGFGGLRLERGSAFSNVAVKGGELIGWGTAPSIEKWGTVISWLSPGTGDFQMGTDTKSVVAVVRVGKGFIAFVGATLFRVNNAANIANSSKRLEQLRGSLERTKDPSERRAVEQKVNSITQRMADQEKVGAPDLPAIENLMAGIVAMASPLSTARASQAWLDQLGSGHAVFWQRDPVINPEVYAFNQSAPGPAWDPAEPQEGEVLQNIAADAGLDDALVVGVNVTATSALPEFRVAWKAGAGGGPAVRVLQAGTLESNGTASILGAQAFWLRPATGDLREGETTLLMLLVSTTGTAVGNYTGTLKASWKGGERLLPVSIAVHPVRFEEKDALELGFYGWSWIGPFPRNLPLLGGPEVLNLDVSGALPVLKNQRELGAGAIVDGTLQLSQIRIEGDLRSLADYLKAGTKPPILNEDGSMKKLDFSGYEEVINAARGLGFSRVNIRHGMAVFVQPSANYVSLLTGEPHLSPAWGKTFVGLWKQFREYLEGHGFTQMTFKYGDELSEESIRVNWTPVAKLAAEAGWAPEMNPTGRSVNLESLNQVAPICGSYSTNVHFVDEVLKWKAEGKFRPLPTAKLGEYGSWGYYKSPAILMRRTCWEAWAKGLRGLDIYTFARLFLFDGKTVFNPASAMGLMTGWRESSFLSQLATVHAAALESKSDLAWTKEAGAFLERIRNGGGGIVWKKEKPGVFPFDVRTLESTTGQLDVERRELFRLLSARPQP